MNVDKQALREAAEKADSFGWDGIECDLDVGPRATEFISCCSPATVLALLDELEAAEERSEDMLRQARSFREAHDSASEIIRKLERNKPIVKLPTTKLWAGKVACYEASEIIELLSAAGIRIKGED